MKCRESTGFAALHSDAMWDADRDLTLQHVGLWVFFKTWISCHFPCHLAGEMEFLNVRKASWILYRSAKLMAVLITHWH